MLKTASESPHGPGGKLQPFASLSYTTNRRLSPRCRCSSDGGSSASPV